MIYIDCFFDEITISQKELKFFSCRNIINIDLTVRQSFIFKLVILAKIEKAQNITKKRLGMVYLKIGGSLNRTHQVHKFRGQLYCGRQPVDYFHRV